MSLADDTEETKETVTGHDDDGRLKLALPGKQLEENSEKTDSGMDEDTPQTSPDTAGLNSDSDDEPVVRKKSVKKHVILDDEDDDDDDDSKSALEMDTKSDLQDSHEDEVQMKEKNVKKKKTVAEAVNSIMDSDSDSDLETAEVSQISGKSGDKSSGDESDSQRNVIRRKKKSKTSTGSEDKETGGSSQQADSKAVKPSMFSSDLFDAEDSSSGSDSESGDEKKDSDSNNSADDEGFDEDNIDPKLKAKLLKMKGAAKQSRKGKDRKAKPKVESLMDLHSESQRLIRESSVVLPYHQPTPKPLNDFLARASKKQQDYKALKAAREFKKPSVIQHVLANSSPAVPVPVSSVSKPDQHQSPATALVDNKEEPGSVEVQQKSNPIEGTSPTLQSVSRKMNFDDDLELPDLDENDQNSENPCEANARTGDSNKPSFQNTETNVEMATDTNLECISEDVSETSKDTKTDNTAIDIQTKVEGEKESLNFEEPKTEEFAEPVTEELEQSSTDDKLDLQSENSTIISKTPKAKLEILTAVKDITPKLSGGPKSFIDFDAEDGSPVNVTGRDKLMMRLLEHAKHKHHKHAKDIDISIVEKEAKTESTSELKLTSITYHVEDEDSEDEVKKLETPGAKLVALKEKLQNKMKVKREEARQKRQELYDLENEEGFEGESEKEDEKILDDDAEMSEKSDTDIEDDQFDAEFGEEEFEDENDAEVETNPFMDAEADEDDDDYEPRNGADDDDDDWESEADGDGMQLKLDTSDDGDEESDLENPSQNVRHSSKKKKRKNVRKLAISDDEESNQPPSAQLAVNRESVQTDKDQGLQGTLGEDEDDMSPLSKHLAPTQTQKLSKMSSLSLPIENSQDLYGNSSEGFGLSAFPAGDTQPSQGINFLVEDSQSQMLDADGFFKVKSTTKKPTQQSLGLNKISNTQDNMEEFMGLCSGRFAEQTQDEKKTSCKQLFDDDTKSSTLPGTQGGMDELLDLCSGFFPKESQKSKSQGIKRKLEDDNESNDSFALLSDTEDHMDSDKDELNDDDNEKGTDEVDGGIVDESSSSPQKFRGFKGRITGKIRREFIEDEAELSGSEAESDEDLEIAAEDDIMEMELGDQDVNITEDELRNQVGRAHLKQTIDEDKREILRLQEMYLPDGDLHSEGGGRTRRFRWKNMDDESQQDMFGDGEGSDDGGMEEDADEQKWRMERFEREKFLQEERENEENENSNSQFFNFAKKFAMKIKNSNKKPSEEEFKMPEKPEQKNTTKTASKSNSQRKGSFLTRSREALAKIAEKTKANINPNAARNSRNFVFQVVSPEKAEVAPEQPKPEKRIAHKKAASLQPPPKRQRTKTVENKSGNSIFKILES